MWDVPRVEVFRGPQTVTQGANSIAGAVVVHTKDPTFQREGAAQLVAGNGGTRRASAMLSGPLAEGELAARLALDYSVRDTFIDYVNPRFAQGDTDQDFAARNARLKLLWRPARLPQLTARLTLAHAYSNRPTNEAASQPFGDFRSNALTMPSFKQWSNSAVADLAWRFDNGMELSNRTVLAHLNVRRSSEPFSNGYALIGMREVTNETKLSFGDERQPWRGALGLFVHRAHSDDLLYTNGRSDFEDRKQNLGLYGEISRRLAGKWLLSGGLRYQRDRVRRHGTTPFARAGMAYGQTFDALLPKLSLAYDISPASTVGLLLSKGYNPGGVNISFARGRVYEFGQESLRNYELFARSSLLDGRMLLTANLFFNDFHHSQRLLPDFLNGQPFGVVTVNADRARARGLELAADWQAHASLRLKAGLGLLHTRITRFTAPNGNLLENKEFSRAPRYSLSLGADWAPHPAVKLALAVRHTARYHSADDNGAAYRVPASTVVNASVSWQATRHVQVFGYVNNLFDRAISTWLYDNRTAGGIVSSMAPPRQLGLGIKAQF